MLIPPDLLSALQTLREVGRPRLVGGCVRDWLLGLPTTDFDIEVAGVDFETLHRKLGPLGSTDIVGRSFGVIKLRLGGRAYDFSLPRRESKVGSGHRGFAVDPDPALTDAEAAARRDFTINAIAYDPFEDAVIDPHGGREDLRRGVMRHTSEAFTEDPLRVLRAFQFASRFNFQLARETVVLCRSIAHTFNELPVERVWGEWAKWASLSIRPGRGLHLLKEVDWLKHFPEVAALDGTPQDPHWHPEGDVFVHTAHCVDALARAEPWKSSEEWRRRMLMFAVLGHDFGKPSTTAQSEYNDGPRWTSRGHESAGGAVAEAFLTSIGAPKDLIAHVLPLIANHHAHFSAQGAFTFAAIRRLARRLHPASMADLVIVMRADHDGRPPIYSEEVITRINLLLSQAESLSIASQAPTPLAKGRHLIALGLQPGERFRQILDEAFEAQLEGAFNDEPSAMDWLKNRLSPSSN